MADESFVERILYRLVRKHISGPTMSSAISKTKELNSKKMPVSITFLSNNIANRAKARYVTTTYIELVRQLSRLGLKASIQIPVDQIGFAFDEDAAVENLRSIVEVANKYGIFVWAEVGDAKNGIFDCFEKFRGVGIAADVADAVKYVKKHKRARPIKVMLNTQGTKKKPYSALVKDIDFLSGMVSNMVLFSTPDETLWEILSKKLNKSVVYEFRFGYSNKKIRKAMKRGAKVSIYMPFGKEWEAYAMNNVPEGYMRFLASKLLSESGSQGGA